MQLHITDRETFRPVTAGLCLISVVESMYPQAFETIKSDRNPDVFYIDLLVGSAQVRQALDNGVDVRDLVEEWQNELADFQSAAVYLYE